MTVYRQAAVERRLKTQRFGRPLVWLEEVGSTNDYARTLADQGATEGTVVVAVRQTAGRGRLGRPWVSPEGGVWMSLVLRPAVSPPPVLPLQCAVAACEAIEAVSDQKARIKWPNDIMLGDEPRKAGGILLESRVTGPDRIVIVGIGINAAVDPGATVPELRPIAIAVGADDVRTELLAELLARLEHRISERSLDAVVARCETLGRHVHVTWEGGEVSGQAVGLDPDGGLIVQPETGSPQTVWSALSVR